MSRSTRLLLALSFMVAAVPLSGAMCPRKNQITGPPGPASSIGLADIDNIWPSEDGRGWDYGLLYRYWGWDFKIQPTPEYFPLPSFDEVAAMLDTLPLGRYPTEDSIAFALEFAGDTTTFSGARGQNLRETFGPVTAGLAPAEGFDRAFLVHLLGMRPDLRARIAPRLASPARVQPSGSPPRPHPNLVHGYAWRKTMQWIGTYGDADTLLAWKFLTANLRLGAQFTHQLVPSLAPDVFLHANVHRRLRVGTPMGTVTGALEVLYIVDYGLSEATDAIGNPIGYIRSYDIGDVVYAPGVGPVSSYERRGLSASDRATRGLGDLGLRLLATRAGSPPDSRTATR